MNVALEFINIPLASGLIVRALTSADEALVTDLVRKVDLFACGETTTTSAELEADLNASWKSGFGSYGVFDGEKLVVALLIHNELADTRGCFFDLFADPAEDIEKMTKTCERLLEKVERITGNYITEKTLQPDYAKTALYKNDLAFLNSLENRKFEYHRTYWRLRIDTTETRVLPATDISIIDFNSSELSFKNMHALSSEIFADHYDFHPMEFDRWKEELTSGVHDPKLWRIALVNGEIAGYCWGSHRFEQEKFGYISSIGVLRKFRGLGVAKALLNDAFQRDFASGMQGSLLHCDAENPNGATALYEGAGMRIDRVYVAYRKLLG